MATEQRAQEGSQPGAPEQRSAQETAQASTGTSQGGQMGSGGSSTSMERRDQRSSGMRPWASSRYTGGPFSLMRRFSEDVDRLFEGFFGSSLLGEEWPASLAQTTRWPEIDVHQEGNRLVIHADVPGLRREDVNVEVRGQELWISGERRSQREGNEAGVFRSERTYGSFCRTIPLPEGANLESASASFENGVLKIEIEAPEEHTRGRRIEVREGSPQ
jgi:HSP20 family protein